MDDFADQLENRTQAIILADSYNNRLSPVCLEKPKALIPLLNVPLLDYNLEFLTAGGVKDIYIVTTAFHKEVKEYVKESPVIEGIRQMNEVDITIVAEESFTNIGDVMRFIKAVGYIKCNPFVLVGADVIANFSLQDVIAEHKERYKHLLQQELHQESSQTKLLTTIFKRASPSHRSRSLENDLFLCISDNRETRGRILRYSCDRRLEECVLPWSALKGTEKEFDLHYDLIDCGINLCSPEILDEFTNLCDFTDLKNNLGLSEVQGYAKILETEYAAQIVDWPTYHGVSLDLIQRWAWPLVPENNLLSQTSYTFRRKNIYIEDGVQLGKNSQILRDTVIGSSTRIGDDTIIDHCVIGRKVVIGRGCKLSHCHIFDNSWIGNRVNMSYSVVADAVVQDNAKVAPGCIFSWKTCVDSDISVSSHTYLTTYDIKTQTTSYAIKKWVSPFFDPDDPNTWIYDPRVTCIKPSAVDDVVVSIKDDSSSSAEQKDPLLDDIREHIILCEQGIEDISNVILKLKAIAQTTASIQEFSLTLFLCIFEVIFEGEKKISQEMIDYLKKLLQKYHTLLQPYTEDIQNQTYILHALTEACLEKEIYHDFCVHTICELYELDIVDEQFIFESWFAELQKRGENDKRLQSIHSSCEVFMEWIRNSSSDEEDCVGEQSEGEPSHGDPDSAGEEDICGTPVAI